VVISSVTLIALFTVVLRILPDAEVEWSEAALGGMVTGLLHVAGQWVLGVYLGQAAIGSAFGTAASLVVFLSWVYYSAVVFLYGAEVSRALSVALRVEV
jgi:membrane protein